MKELKKNEEEIQAEINESKDKIYENLIELVIKINDDKELETKVMELLKTIKYQHQITINNQKISTREYIIKKEEEIAKDIIVEISHAIKETIQDDKYFSAEKIIKKVIEEYLKEDNNINKHFEKDKEAFLLPKTIKERINENHEEIEDSWNTMQIIYDRDLKRVLNRMGKKEQTEIVKKVIKEILKTEINIKKYLSQCVSKLIKTVFIDDELLHEIIKYYDEKITEINMKAPKYFDREIEKRLNKIHTNEIIQTMFVELYNEEGMKAIETKVVELLKEDLEIQLNNDLVEYLDFTDTVEEELYNNNKENTKTQDLIEYVEDKDEWLDIRKEIDDYELFLIIEKSESNNKRNHK